MELKQKISPCLWFDGEAEEAARFYTSTFPDSRIDHVEKSSIDWPGGKAGDVILVEFTLAGLSYQALNGGPHDGFNNAISLSVVCVDQTEVDRLWGALTANGGKPIQCGWLKDKFGLSRGACHHDERQRSGKEEARHGGHGADGETRRCQIAASLQWLISRLPVRNLGQKKSIRPRRIYRLRRCIKHLFGHQRERIMS